jgi:hypothetical protein
MRSPAEPHPYPFSHFLHPPCWRRTKARFILADASSLVSGKGEIVTRCSKLKRIYEFLFQIAGFLANIFREKVFRDFTGLDSFYPVDSSSNTTCSFSWFFLFVFFFWWWEVGGGRIVARWALWRLFCTFAVLEVPWGSFNRLLFPRMFSCRELIGMLLKQ